jgi:RimJ/RimL family protein N-acetyltransferase
VAPNYIPLELTAYMHPDHQNKGYFTASAKAIVSFTRERFSVTHLKAVIHPSNTVVRDIAAARGFAKEQEITADGYEIWIAPSDVIR